MAAAIIILILFALWGASDKRKRLRRQRERAEAERLEKKRQQEDIERRYPGEIIKIRFPNPATSTMADIEEYIAGEDRVAALEEFIRFARKLNAPKIVEDMADKKIAALWRVIFGA